MNIFRKLISFLVTGILTAFVMEAFCGPTVLDCVSILRSGWGVREYLIAAANEELIALISRYDGGFLLTCGNTSGQCVSEYRAEVPSAGECIAESVYPVSDGSVFFSLYEPDGGCADNLVLYRVAAGTAPEKLLSYPCAGEGPDERMKNTFISGFAELDGSVRFALTDGNTLHTYIYGKSGSGLVQQEPQTVTGVLSAAFQADGTLALGGRKMLMVNGRNAVLPPEDFIAAQLTHIGSGFFCMDSSSLKVFYWDPTGTECAEVFDLSGFGQEKAWDSVSFTGNEKALVLRGGHILSLVDGRGETVLNNVLYRSPAVCAFLLAGIAFIWLIVTTAVWFIFSGMRNSHLPFAVHMGALLMVFELSAGSAFNILVIHPFINRSVLGEARHTVEGAAELSPGGSAAEALSGLSSGEYRGAGITAYENESGVWRVAAGGTLQAGSRAVFSPGFDMDVMNGTESRFTDDGEALRLYLKNGGSVTQISVPGGAFHERIGNEYAKLSRMVWAVLAALWLCVFLVLLLEGSRLRRVGKVVEAFSGGNDGIRLKMRTGDEFESLAESLNSLAAAMEKQRDSESGLIRSYRRFVPERVLGLLGKDSILSVDRHTFASHRMSAMMVWFSFPDRVYDNSTRALFDNINEVIERTSAVVAGKGGTVFNFAYNGYDVVIGGSEADAISTAVAVRQEVLSLNERREAAGVPAVSLRIALDVGEMMIGVVGDESQMEPATISSSFTTARRLIGLAQRLDAGILCTENIMRGASGYGSRYMGKSQRGDGMIRVYEIFDGDIYSIRRGKANSGQRFSKAVLSLYSHDFAEAKKMFLELVHENPNDGGARYYLYLADRLEKQPEQEISLEY